VPIAYCKRSTDWADLRTKLQDKQIADGAEFEQPVRPIRGVADSGLANTQVRYGPSSANNSMFIGEFLCCIPLLWQRSRNRGSGYVVVPSDDFQSDIDHREEETLSGWRMGWMWFPAFFDSESSHDRADIKFAERP
jgi:hypothetical protein